MEEEKVPVTEWLLYVTGGWKPHWCPIELLAGLMQDAGAHGKPQGFFEPAHHGVVDLPGMIMADRTYQDFDLGGFTLSIPTEDIEHYYDKIRYNPLRTFGDGKEYYKIHGWLHCVVLTPSQRKELIGMIEVVLPAARKQSKIEKEEFRRRIAKINSGGTRVMSFKAPDSIPKTPLSGKKNNEKN